MLMKEIFFCLQAFTFNSADFRSTFYQKSSSHAFFDELVMVDNDQSDKNKSEELKSTAFVGREYALVSTTVVGN